MRARRTKELNAYTVESIITTIDEGLNYELQ